MTTIPPGERPRQNATRQCKRHGIARNYLIVIICCVVVLGGLSIVIAPRVIRHFQRSSAATAAAERRARARKPAPVVNATPTTRQSQIKERDVALKSNDLVKAATINAALSQDALQRASRVETAWMRWQDKKTKLFPQNYHAPFWTYENTAADCFGFLLDVGLRQNTKTLPALNAALDAEAKLVPPGALCENVQIHTLAHVDADELRKIFISSEYVKDGLLSVFERNGPNPSTQRMYTVMDNLLAHSTYPSKAGLIPSTGSEENGNMLQACSRLAYAANRDDYAELAARIADAAVMQMLPANDGLPVMGYDYKTDVNLVEKVKLRDHGSEIIPGMTEIYALAVARRDDPKWKERADRWADPIATMFEKIFKYGRNKDGLLVSVLHPRTHKQTMTEPNDTWGYLLNGVLLFTQAARMQGTIDPARIDALEKLVDSTTKNVSKVRDFSWQAGEMDGYADTLESGMYMANHRPSLAPIILPWVDDQMAHLFAFQRTNGFVDRGYLDGNFIRTALMYADLRSGGFYVMPWRADVSVGFAKNSAGQAVLLVSTDKPYTGVLHADTARHSTILHLPWDWPRLNSWPEWFVPTDSMKIIDSHGTATTPTIATLQAGMPLDLPAGGVMTIRIDTNVSGTAKAE